MLKHIFAFAKLAIVISFGIIGCQPKNAEAQYGFEGLGPLPYAQNPLAVDSAADFATSGADYARAEKLAGALAFRKRQAMAAAIDAKEMERNNILLRRYMCERFCGPLSPLAYDSGVCPPDVGTQYSVPQIPYAPPIRRPINPYLGRREAFREGELAGISEGEAIAYEGGGIPACVATGTCGVPPGAFGGYGAGYSRFGVGANFGVGVGAGVYRAAPRAPRVPITAAGVRPYEAAANGVRPYALPFRRRVAESIRY
jgi:hypothetical protein